MNYFQVTTIKRLLEHKKGYLYLASLWTLLIAYLCLTDFNKLPTIEISGLDKSVHFILHFIFTLLWYLYVKSTIKLKWSIAFVVLLDVVYGSLIELGQAFFTITRKGDVIDVLANSVGTAAAVIVIYVFLQLYRREDLK
jgi:VanZ family protein